MITNYMKSIIAWLLISSVSFYGFSQVSSLSDLATGQLVSFSPIMDIDSELFGYMGVYKLGEVEKGKEKFEYVILDKNLNAVANGEFINAAYRGMYSRFMPPEKIGNSLIVSEAHIHATNSNKVFTTHRILSLDDNEMSEPFYLKEGEVIEGERNQKGLGKDQRNTASVDVLIASGKGFISYPISKYGKSNKNTKSIMHYNPERQQTWEYIFNPYGVSHKKTILHIDESFMLFSIKDDRDEIDRSEFLKRVNMENGKEEFSYQIDNIEGGYSHSFQAHVIDDKTYVIGRMSPYAPSGYDYQKAEGFFKIVLDSVGNELAKKYVLWEDVKEFIDVDEKGRLEDKSTLHSKEYFVLKDGSVVILTEKLKERGVLFSGLSATDLVLLQFDKDFNLKDEFTIKKDKSSSWLWSLSDYLYSQYVADAEGVVFFYRDYKKEVDSKEKNWILGIVSIIDGKVNHEIIPMSSEEHFIMPYVAKEGYILLREFNKDSDYDQIRLERINY